MKTLKETILEKLKLADLKQSIDSIKIKNFQEYKDYILDQYIKDNVNLDLRGLDFSEGLMTNGFKIVYYVIKNSDAASIKRIDVSGWKFSEKTTKLRGLFSGFTNVEEIIGLDTWDVSNITVFDEMFEYCRKLKKLDGIETWDMSKASEMEYMFQLCSSLESIDISNWKTDNLKSIDFLFSACHNLQTIKGIENLNVNKVFSMKGTFAGCKTLTKLDLSSWKFTDGLLFADRLFNECENLESVGDISNWDISKIDTMYEMFAMCNKLKLDLSSWNISYRVNTKKIFYKVNSKIFKKANLNVIK